MKNHPDNYDGFLYDPETGMPLDVETFCNRFVDPVGVEAGQRWFILHPVDTFLSDVGRHADHMQMTALCRELKLNLDVAYLDGRKADAVDFVQFRDGPEGETPLTLLYRYDFISSLCAEHGLIQVVDLVTTTSWSRRRSDRSLRKACGHSDYDCDELVFSPVWHFSYPISALIWSILALSSSDVLSVSPKALSMSCQTSQIAFSESEC